MVTIDAALRKLAEVKDMPPDAAEILRSYVTDIDARLERIPKPISMPHVPLPPGLLPE
jgi:hypothetical protein